MESTEQTTEWFRADYKDHGEKDWIPGTTWNSYHAAWREAEAVQQELPFADVRIVETSHDC